MASTLAWIEVRTDEWKRSDRCSEDDLRCAEALALLRRRSWQDYPGDDYLLLLRGMLAKRSADVVDG